MRNLASSDLLLVRPGQALDTLKDKKIKNPSLSPEGRSFLQRVTAYAICNLIEEEPAIEMVKVATYPAKVGIESERVLCNELKNLLWAHSIEVEGLKKPLLDLSDSSAIRNLSTSRDSDQYTNGKFTLQAVLNGLYSLEDQPGSVAGLVIAPEPIMSALETYGETPRFEEDPALKDLERLRLERLHVAGVIPLNFPAIPFLRGV